MENIIIDLKIRNEELIKENTALKTKIALMYSNWHFDLSRFTLLKGKCKSGYCNDNNDSDEISIRK